MKRSRLSLLFASAFVLLLAALLITFNHQKPRILVLQTYAEDGTWEMAVDNGIRRQLAQSLEPLTTRWHYMSFAGQEVRTNWEAAAQHSRQVIDTWRPDILIAVGEEAQKYVGRHYAGAGGMTLVYGVGEDPDSFGYRDAANVTGVREALPLAQIVEVLRHVGGGRPLRIRVLGVDDLTGMAERQQTEAFSWEPHRLAGVQLVADYAEWQREAQKAAADADVLLLLSYGGLARHKGASGDVPAAELAKWTEQASRIPVISVRATHVSGGGALAVSPSPEALGEQLAQQALAVLDSKRHGKPLPPPQASVDFQISMRPELLARRGISLPSIYLQAARASHTLYLPREPAP